VVQEIQPLIGIIATTAPIGQKKHARSGFATRIWKDPGALARSAVLVDVRKFALSLSPPRFYLEVTSTRAQISAAALVYGSWIAAMP
jgi:hypothetical protein